MSLPRVNRLIAKIAHFQSQRMTSGIFHEFISLSTDNERKTHSRNKVRTIFLTVAYNVGDSAVVNKSAR